MPLRIRAAYLSCCLLWGSTWMVIKLGLRDLPPFLFAGTRMLLAAAVLLPFAARAGLREYDRRDWGRVGFIGVLQIGLPYALLFAGQQWVPSALAAVLFATFPVWLVLIARLMLPGQPLTPRKIAAALLGIAGVFLLQLPALRGQALSPLAAVGGALVLSASALIAPISAIGAIPLLDTTVAVMLGALVLGEKLGWPLLAGGVLVLSGAALANQVPAEPA